MSIKLCVTKVGGPPQKMLKFIPEKNGPGYDRVIIIDLFYRESKHTVNFKHYVR